MVIIGHAYLCQFGRAVGTVVYLGKLNLAFDSYSRCSTFELDNKLHRILQYMYRERTGFPSPGRYDPWPNQILLKRHPEAAALHGFYGGDPRLTHQMVSHQPRIMYQLVVEHPR